MKFVQLKTTIYLELYFVKGKITCVESHCCINVRLIGTQGPRGKDCDQNF